MLWLGGAAPPKAQDAHAPGATSASRQCSPAASHSPQPPGTDRSFASLVPRLTSSQIDELIRNALQRQRHQEANGVGRHQAGQMATVCRNLEEASPRGTGAKFVAVPKSTLETKKTTKKRPASPGNGAAIRGSNQPFTRTQSPAGVAHAQLQQTRGRLRGAGGDGGRLLLAAREFVRSGGNSRNSARNMRAPAGNVSLEI